PDAFLFLRNSVLPELIERGRQRGRAMRLWSAGCSTGEEAYSLVITLADLLGNEQPEWNIKVFATDVDEQAVAFARRGLYPPNVLGSLPDDYRSRFFEPADQGLRISKPLRQMVIFGLQDIGHGVPFPRIDMVVCRNLLIYFKPELQQEVLDLFAYSLHQTHGYLFLGKAETARPSKSVFELIHKKWKVYRCISGPLPVPVRPAAAALGLGVMGRAQVRTEPEPASLIGLHEESDIAQLRRSNELLLRFLPVGIAVIDPSYRIVTLNGTARRLLGVRDTGIDQDFLHSA